MRAYRVNWLGWSSGCQEWGTGRRGRSGRLGFTEKHARPLKMHDFHVTSNHYGIEGFVIRLVRGAFSVPCDSMVIEQPARMPAQIGSVEL